MKLVEVRCEDTPRPTGTYAQAVGADSFIFVSGQVPADRDRRLVGRGDIKAQTRQVFENIRKVLEAAGFSLDRVVKVTVYLTDIRLRPQVMEVREEFFPKHRPASTMVEVSGLGDPEWLIEVDAIALVSS